MIPKNCPNCKGEREWAVVDKVAICHFCGKTENIKGEQKMFKVQMLVKTPLGLTAELTTGKITEFKSEKERDQMMDVFADNISKLTYMNFENELGQIVILPKEVIQNSVFFFETKET